MSLEDVFSTYALPLEIKEQQIYTDCLTHCFPFIDDKTAKIFLEFFLNVTIW